MPSVHDGSRIHCEPGEGSRARGPSLAHLTQPVGSADAMILLKSYAVGERSDVHLNPQH